MAINPIANTAPAAAGVTLIAGEKLALMFTFTGADASPGDQYTVTVKDASSAVVPMTWDTAQGTLGAKVGGQCVSRFVANAGVPNPGNYTVELQRVAPVPSPTPALVVNLTVTPAPVAAPPPVTTPPATPPAPGAPPAPATTPTPPAGPTQVQATVQHSFGGSWTFAGVVIACLLAIGLCLWGVTWTLNWGKDFLGAGVGHAVEQHQQEQDLLNDGKISIEIGMPDLSASGVEADSASFRVTAEGDVTGLRIPPTGTSSP